MNFSPFLHSHLTGLWALPQFTDPVFYGYRPLSHLANPVPALDPPSPPPQNPTKTFRGGSPFDLKVANRISNLTDLAMDQVIRVVFFMLTPASGKLRVMFLQSQHRERDGVCRAAKDLPRHKCHTPHSSYIQFNATRILGHVDRGWGLNR